MLYRIGHAALSDICVIRGLEKRESRIENGLKKKKLELWLSNVLLCASMLMAMWMDLEGIMLNEISQTEKDKYHMISFICGI